MSFFSRKFFASIGTKIIFTFSGLFVSVVLIAGFYLDRNSSEQIASVTFRDIQNINHNKAENIRTFLRSEKEIVEMLAADTTFADFLSLSPEDLTYSIEKEEVSEELNNFFGEDAKIYQIVLIDAAGKIVVSTDVPEEGIDRSQDDFFTNAKKGVYVKDFYFSDIIHKNTYAVSAPIKDEKTGEFRGVIVARMNPQNLYDILNIGGDNTQTQENFLVNREQYLISKTRFLGEDAILKKQLNMANVEDCFAASEIANTQIGEYPSEINLKNYIDYRGVPIIGTHAYIPETGWCLITKMDTMEAVAPSRQMLFVFYVTGFLATAIFVSIGFLLSRKIIHPIRSLQRSVEKVRNGDLDHRVGMNSLDEVGDLSRSFDEMTVAIKRSRAEVDQKVREQTIEIVENSKKIEEQQRATLNILEDIEKEKENAELLAKDLEKFKLAVEGASDHIVITDSDGMILYANASVEKITGFSRTEILGKKAGAGELWGGLMDLEFYKTMWRTIKEQKKPFSGDVQNRRKNGVLYQAYATISPIVGDDGKVLFFVGIERDVTSEREIDKAKTEFVSLASHQLRTPLSAIGWYTEMLLAGDAGAVSSDQKQYLEEIVRGNSRMTELVNSLLNVSRIELGTFLVDPKPSDVADIARKAIEEQREIIQNKELQLTVDIQERVPEISVDPKLFWMIVQNLSSNAIKYTPEKGRIIVTLRIAPKGESFGGRYLSQDSLCLSVADTGYGIPLNQQEKIFSKLFRADNVLTKDTDGTGLGLYLIKSIVDNGGGEIWFQSEEDKGSTFFVIFPKTGMLKRDGTRAIG
ncbi:MAG: ATP-binding protein [Candidatus Moraniibacteriota bacterium]